MNLTKIHFYCASSEIKIEQWNSQEYLDLIVNLRNYTKAELIELKNHSKEGIIDKDAFIPIVYLNKDLNYIIKYVVHDDDNPSQDPESSWI